MKYFMKYSENTIKKSYPNAYHSVRVKLYKGMPRL